jgi:DNA repair exonuclease SbcCD nuclease subunit
VSNPVRPSGGLTVVHSSDIHVDDDDYTRRLYDGDGARGLRLVLDTAVRVAADIVILAGDVFENNRVPTDLLDRVTCVLGDAPLPVVILPGNHDPVIDESVYRRGELAEPANVHILGVTHGSSVVLPAFDLEVWGHAHCDYGDMRPLRRPRPKKSRWRIATAHGHYDPKPNRQIKLRPAWLFGDDEIAAANADYVALGHWNRAIRVGGKGLNAYYSGSPDLANTVNVVHFSGDGGVKVGRESIGWKPRDNDGAN